MKLLDTMKRNKLPSAVALAYVLLFAFKTDTAFAAVKNSAFYLKEMMIILPVIYMLTTVIDVLVPREAVIKNFGENSGMKGNVLALALGSVSAGPVYAAFPIAKMLLQRGASISNIVILLGAWAVIKIPMLANEARFLGPKFMVARWVLTVISIFIMGQIVQVFVKRDDMPLPEPDAEGTRTGEGKKNQPAR
ncbi:MAG TPA: permease [Clostridiales bacterium]|jgi:uncharacterized membrane protein YraQ (UPF0718 family)|nr:permease [Clostridiales bacterium]